MNRPKCLTVRLYYHEVRDIIIYCIFVKLFYTITIYLAVLSTCMLSIMLIAINNLDKWDIVYGKYLTLSVVIAVCDIIVFFFLSLLTHIKYIMFTILPKY